MVYKMMVGNDGPDFLEVSPVGSRILVRVFGGRCFDERNNDFWIA
jgi:hypothetical protein